MNFTRLGYFLIAAKYLNFTKAANVLYITQPSLSKQIAQFEEELGMLLFDRSKRTLFLTSAGKYMYQEFNRLMPEIKAIVEKAKRMRDDDVKTLIVGCVETISLGDEVINMVSSFTQDMGDVELYVDRCVFDVLNDKIMDGAVDVAFTISSQVKQNKDVMCVELEQRKRYVIMSANHRLASRKSISFEDLRDETFTLFDPEIIRLSYDDIFEECRKTGFFPKVRYAPNNNTILDYLEMSGCIAFLDKSIAENRKGRLKYFPLPPGNSFSLVCVWRKDNTNPALLEFIKYLPKH